MRSILITGCTRGLGRALVNRFAEQGHTIAGCGRSPDQIVELQNHFPAPHSFQTVDVSDSTAVQSWADTLNQAGFVPDLLINNGGIINRNAPLWRVSEDEFNELIDINIKGVANVLRSFLPLMTARATGVVANISSGWGRSVSGEVAPYVCSKWAIEGLTKALAEELPPGMAAVPLNPGVVNTDLLQSCYGAVAGNYPDAEEWSYKAAAVLLSINQKHNGQSLTV